MSRPVHFEIQADDVDRAKTFYAEAFGWEFQDYSAVTGSTYWGIATGPTGTPGIDGGLLQRPAASPPGGREPALRSRCGRARWRSRPFAPSRPCRTA